MSSAKHAYKLVNLYGTLKKNLVSLSDFRLSEALLEALDSH